jgi:hypothetical protein
MYVYTHNNYIQQVVHAALRLLDSAQRKYILKHLKSLLSQKYLINLWLPSMCHKASGERTE